MLEPFYASKLFATLRQGCLSALLTSSSPAVNTKSLDGHARTCAGSTTLRLTRRLKEANLKLDTSCCRLSKIPREAHPKTTTANVSRPALQDDGDIGKLLSFGRNSHLLPG